MSTARLQPRRVERLLRRGVLALVVVMVVYLVWRYETLRLPDVGCSPLARYAPGVLLVVDTQPPSLAPGDAVLFRGPAGEVLLAQVASREPDAPLPERLWLETDAPACPGRASPELGWIDRAAIGGRVMLALP